MAKCLACIKTSTRHGCKLGIFNRFFIEILDKREIKFSPKFHLKFC